jgi:tRNA(fMet)-specific endonuclease VapC
MEEKVRGHKFAITFVTLAELDLGFLKARNPMAAVQRGLEVLRDVSVLNGSGTTPMIYAQVYFDLEQRGTMIPVNDIWIAAMALELKLPLLARDEHFSRVRGLSVI